MRSLPATVALAVLMAAPAAHGDTFPPVPPAKERASPQALAERMRALVSTQCASCHENGPLAAKAGSFGAAFDLTSMALEDLADDQILVKRGFAEGSPLFHALISKHRPSDLGTTGGLAADEILTVRDWIENLPEKAPCSHSTAADDVVLTPADKPVFVISLRHLADGCRPAGRIAEWRPLATDLAAALSHSAPSLRSIDANGLAFAVDTVTFDRLTGADLEALRAMMTSGSVRLEDLAAFVVARGLPLADAVRSRVAALARLADAPGQRQDEIGVTLSAVASRVKSGDVLSLTASATMACHLTIVSIDSKGRALILFPNEIEEDNLIEPGKVRMVPDAAAGYQVRFDTAGTETFLAHCRRGKTTFDGVKVDYEKQRFPVLGDWRGFIAVMDERQSRIEKEKQAGDARRSRRRGRGRDGAAKPAAAPPVDPKSGAEGWAALRITVE